MDIKITNIDPLTGLVTLGLNNNTKTVSNMDLLAQIVSLKLLKTFDQDVFDPKEGTDFRADIGQYNFAADDVEEIRLLAVSQIQKIEQDIIEEQGTNLGTPSERLLKLRLMDIAGDVDTGSVAIRVQIVNESGNTRDIVV